MMRSALYRLAIISGILAFAALIFVQAYWFIKSYRVEERQFSERVNLALRSVTDQILKSQKKNDVTIKPVQQPATNRFYVAVGEYIDYPLIDSLVRKEFSKQRIDAPFSLTLFNESGALILGNVYHEGTASKDSSSCVGRPQQQANMNFSVTFMNHRANIIGAMDLWIFTAGTFALILMIFAFVLADITRQKRNALAKNDYLGNMAHELKTPITNISMASEVLLKNPAFESEKQSRYLEIISEENQRLKHQVDQVLEITAMDINDLRLNKQQVNLNELIEKVLENFRIRIEQKSGIINRYLKATNAYVSGDPLHLSNIFYNLLDNAEKYSIDKPQITVRSENIKQWVKISVEDKGIGIGTASQRSIFDKYYRVSTGNLHDVKGFGLGLSYVKKMVEAHNGVITVTSQLNSGSLFTISFPGITQES